MTKPFVAVVFRPLAVLLLVFVVVATAHAQGGPVAGAPAPRPERAFVSVGFGSQVRTPGFSEVRTVPLYGEEATFDVRYGAKGGSAFGLAGGARVWRGVWLGVAWAQTSHRHDVDVSGRLPHPFRFNDVRTVEGTRTGLKREESGVHLQVMYRMRLARRFNVGVFAGPSWIKATRNLVDEVNYDEEYPYDTATFEGMTIVNGSATGTAIGFGANVSMNVFGPLSLGVEVRRAATKVDFSTPSGGTMRATVGGTQALVGAQVVF